MFRRRSLALFPALALVLACEPNGFRTELKGEATVPGGPDGPLPGFPTLGAFTNVDFNATPEFKSQGVTKDHVSSARTEAVKVRVVSPTDQDFGFLETLQLYIRSGDREALIAERSGIAALGLAAPGPTLALEVKTDDLRLHIAAPSSSLILRAKGNVPPKDTRLEVTVDFRVGF